MKAIVRAGRCASSEVRVRRVPARGPQLRARFIMWLAPASPVSGRPAAVDSVRDRAQQVQVAACGMRVGCRPWVRCGGGPLRGSVLRCLACSRRSVNGARARPTPPPTVVRVGGPAKFTYQAEPNVLSPCKGIRSNVFATEEHDAFKSHPDSGPATPRRSSREGRAISDAAAQSDASTSGAAAGPPPPERVAPAGAAFPSPADSLRSLAGRRDMTPWADDTRSIC